MNKESIIHLLKTEKEKREKRSKTKKTNIGEVIKIGTSFLRENPYQPRIKYEDINTLAESLKKDSQIQPITITPIKDSNGLYYIVAGHRRTKAAKVAGLMTINAIVVKDMTNEELRKIAIAENLHRSQLKPVEIAIFIKEIQRDDPNIKKKDIAKLLNISQSAVSNYLKASSLNVDLLIKLKEIGVKRDILLVLSKIKNEELLNKAVVEIQKNPLIKVKELEELTHQTKKRKFEIKLIPTSVNVYFGVALNVKEQEIMREEINKAISNAAVRIKHEQNTK